MPDDVRCWDYNAYNVFYLFLVGKRVMFVSFLEMAEGPELPVACLVLCWSHVWWLSQQGSSAADMSSSSSQHHQQGLFVLDKGTVSGFIQLTLIGYLRMGLGSQRPSKGLSAECLLEALWQCQQRDACLMPSAPEGGAECCVQGHTWN